MQTVLIVIHLLVVIALVGVVLIQRSEGGGLGIGGGSGFMTARGTKNALTRLTAILALCFFMTSIGLVVLDSISNPASDIIKRIPVTDTKTPDKAEPAATQPAGGQAPADNTKQPTIYEQLGGKNGNGKDNQAKPETDKPAPVEEKPASPQPENPVPNN
ncbi:preprotein translocase subunit SecG [uncultured Bartonella sp.]|uniref:preprotein translocase subunit SecG n=1 Tax=uncultured Bartonella sp. TaxID=104108 RepID=UPI002625FA2C|nr:preprotein translocase subunit SecG [uncultured Bartonella sp.]